MHRAKPDSWRTRLQGPLQLMTDGYKKYGEVFTIPVFHKKVTFVLGPHASPHFFNATDDKMSQTEVRFNMRRLLTWTPATCLAPLHSLPRLDLGHVP